MDYFCGRCNLKLSSLGNARRHASLTCTGANVVRKRRRSDDDDDDDDDGSLDLTDSFDDTSEDSFADVDDQLAELGDVMEGDAGKSLVIVCVGCRPGALRACAGPYMNNANAATTNDDDSDSFDDEFDDDDDYQHEDDNDDCGFSEDGLGHTAADDDASDDDVSSEEESEDLDDYDTSPAPVVTIDGPLQAAMTERERRLVVVNNDAHLALLELANAVRVANAVGHRCT
jgi:hypothetical protein